MKRYHFLARPWFVLTILLVSFSISNGQQKKPLDHDVYEFWNKLKQNDLSENGQWMVYSFGPEDKDETLEIKSTSGEKSFRFERGSGAAFSNDSHFAAFLIKAHKDSVKKAKRDKKKPDQMPKDSLGILDLNTSDVVKIPRVKSFKMPKEGAGWLAYLLEKSESKKDTSKTAENKEAKKPAKKDKKSKKTRKKVGTDLVLRNLASGEEQRFEHVLSYLFSENGRWLVFTTANKDSSADGIFAVETRSGRQYTILSGKGDYKQAAMDEAGGQVAFLSNKDHIGDEQPEFTLYHWRTGASAPKALAKSGTPDLPDGWWVSEHGKVEFSQNGSRLLFGSAPRPELEPEDEETEDEKVKVDIWNWKDPYLQPMQLKQVKQERKRSYLAVVHLRNGKVVQLATQEIPDVQMGDEGTADVALGISNLPYRQLISWDFPRYNDVYLIDVATGKSRLIAKKLQARAQLSPKGKYVTWWNRDELAWYALNVKRATPVNLTVLVPHPLFNELHDWPYRPNPYGSAGWTENDELFLIYDRFDIWAVNPTGKRTPRNLTEGVGRRDTLRFRYLKLDPEERAIKPDQTMLFSAFHERSKAGGFFHDRVRSHDKPVKLVLEDRRFSRPKKAKNAAVLLYTRSSFAEFPDLWVSDFDLRNPRKMTLMNPQQAEYLWGTAELMEWTSLDGVPLQGLLIKPENFDPQNKYPMMVYFYERNSHNLHRHWTPEANRSIINFSFYASRGYVVFVPDIPYKVGYPGESALNAVLPGVTHLIKLGFVDEKNIGVQGHSWGGYQIAYMVTQTNIFKAAEAGAPVSNMISAYGGIRWGSGMSRMFQYERTQSRIGGSLWEVPMRYIENSPIFWVDKVETPLLIMHNDHDTAVPWYQGIELFVALRRLGKPVWLINYNDEPHWPTKFHNKKDWTIRMQQFFDHYLKGAPEPVWMCEGVPATQKGKTLGLETSTNGTNR
ncbi:MAG: prolyl oligopeptidase family serine peptidase [bacterium]